MEEPTQDPGLKEMRQRRRHRYHVKPEPGSLGWAIREGRERLGLTQSELGAKVDLVQAQISAYEIGRVLMPDPETLAAMDDLFGQERGTLLAKSGWGGASHVVKMAGSSNARVVVDPSPTMHQLLDLVSRLDDDDLRSLAKDAQFLVRQRGAADDQDEEDAEPQRA